MANTDLTDTYRSYFEIPNDITYLNCAFLSPFLRATREAAERALDIRNRPWELSSSVFFKDAERTRELFAEIIGGCKEGVALVPSVSYGMSVAAKNLNLPRGSSILIPDGEFPSNVYVWREVAKQCGLELKTIPVPANGDWTSAVLKLLDKSVSMISVPPCHWTDGSKFDLKLIGQRAREVGAKFIVDGSQAIGTFPLSVDEWDPDYLMCVGYKWLLGPYGISFLYVPKRHREGQPIEYGWLNRKGCEDLSRLCEYTDELTDGARRFDMGQRANFILLPMMNAALETLLTWGLATVENTILKTAVEIEKQLRARGAHVVPLENRMPHIIGVKVPSAKQVAATLAEQKVFVSARNDVIRISPHVHVGMHDVEKLVRSFPADGLKAKAAVIQA